METCRRSKGPSGSIAVGHLFRRTRPIAKQIVTRANQSIGEFGPIFQALGMTGGTDIELIKKNMDARCDAGPDAEAQRAACGMRLRSRNMNLMPMAWK